MKTLIVLSAAVFLFCALSAAPTAARTWHIMPDGTGDAPTIQAGVDSAVVGDVVEVACGTYYDCTHEIPGGWPLACAIMKSGITLRSETGEANCVTLDAQGVGIGIYCDGVDDSSVIEGLHLINGFSYGSYGGGIHCSDSSPTVKQCHFSNNTSSGNATFAGGGGMKCVASSWPTIIGCVFSENNSSSGDGGGLQSWGNCTVVGCTFIGNSADIGGGVSVDGNGAAVTLDNCLFVDNQADCGCGSHGGGGGIAVVRGSVSLSNCTITDNEAVGHGGGVFVSPFSATLTAFNTDILDNTAPDGPDGNIRESGTALLTCCDVDLGQWFVEEGGNLILDNEGCGVAVEAKTWGGVKALYR